MSFSPAHVALEGFRLTRREPKLVAALALVWAAFMAVALLIESQTIISVMKVMEEIGAGGRPSDAQATVLGGYYGRLFAVLALPYLVTTSIMIAAVHRAVQAPGEGKYAYVRFGRDELRVAGVSLTCALLFGALGLLGGFVVGIFVGLATVVPPMVLGGVLAGFAIVAGMVGLWAGLLLAMPMTMDRRKIVIVGALRAIRGNFWRMVGVALMSALLAVGVGLLIGFISMPFVQLTGGFQALVAAGYLTASSVSGVFVWLLFQSISYAAQMIIMQAPLSAAWLEIKGTSPDAR